MAVMRISQYVRFRIAIVLGIVAMLLVGAVGIWWSSGAGTANEDSDSESSSSILPSQPNSEGGELRVVDTGISATVDAFDEPMASYGVVLENTSQQVAFRVTAAITMSANDTTVKDLNNDSGKVEHAVYAVLPGEKAAIAATTYVDNENVSDVDVVLDEPEWLPADNPDPPFASLTAGDVEVEVDNHLIQFTFVVRSEYESPIENPATQALLRDGDGDIVGGTNATESQAEMYQPGDSKEKIESRGGLPEDFDPVAVEVYPAPMSG